jgi:hypothetical protein
VEPRPRRTAAHAFHIQHQRVRSAICISNSSSYEGETEVRSGGREGILTSMRMMPKEDADGSMLSTATTTRKRAEGAWAWGASSPRCRGLAGAPRRRVIPEPPPPAVSVPAPAARAAVPSRWCGSRWRPTSARHPHASVPRCLCADARRPRRRTQPPAW